MILVNLIDSALDSYLSSTSTIFQRISGLGAIAVGFNNGSDGMDFFPINTQCVRKFKKVQPKELMKSNKSISRIIFWPNSIFCNFKNGQKSIFELGKKFKTSTNAISRRKILIYLISRVFFPRTFFIFSGPLPLHTAWPFFPTQTTFRKPLKNHNVNAIWS